MHYMKLQYINSRWYKEIVLTDRDEKTDIEPQEILLTVPNWAVLTPPS